MHTLAFLDPAHFHAALTLRERHPRVGDEIFVYAPEGPDLADFLALVEAFNRRAERPTRWRPILRAGERSLERLIAERPAEIAILAGRNDGKMAAMRRLHDAGFHVLADKPWLTGAHGLDDLRHTLAGGPVAAEIMTGRHEITSWLVQKLVADPEVFGHFRGEPGRRPDVEIASVHHLEKTVNGAPLRRPAWFFDVRVQGDGIADIPTHMVDQAQRLVAAASRASVPLELVSVRRWATRVPRTMYARVTGEADFPPGLGDLVDGADLSYYGNAELSFRVGGVTADLDTRWDLSAPAGGGDTHRSVVRGSRAEVRVEQDASTSFRRRLSVVPRGGAAGVDQALDRAVASWQAERPGVALSSTGDGWEILVPRALDAGHEGHFPLVLADFLELVERGGAPSRAADSLAKYELLARASAASSGLSETRG